MSDALPVTDPVTLDKDMPLQDDIRLLGQILGDTLRDQDGEDAFEIVEAVRRLSIAFQRRADATAGRDLDTLLSRLARARPSRSFAPSAISRTSPTLPRIATMCAGD